MNDVKFNKCRIPADAESASGVRLLCLSDAAEHAGGAIVYAGRKLINGDWSCAMFTAKSKLMNSTIPRNELSAIMLMTELAFIVKRSLEEKVSEVVYVTDSTIAMSWCHNPNIKLRLYVKNRVETIRRMIEWTTDAEDVPLYHVEGSMNIADFLTKSHVITPEQVSLRSVWQDGLPWMKKDTGELPLKKYSELTVGKKQEIEVLSECFKEPFLPDEGLTNLQAMSAELPLFAGEV